MRGALLIPLLLAAGAAPAAAAAPVRAGQLHAGEGVFLTLDEALALAFPGCKMEKRTFYPTKEQQAEIGRRAGTHPLGSVVTAWEARREGVLVGTAWTDTHKVRTMPATLLIAVGPDARVQRVEVLAFREPRAYLPRGDWLAQFRGRALDDTLQIKRGVRGIAGATLTARAATDAVRRALAQHAVLAAAAGK
ncbi:MAG TPA: FMN-binding protein [Planctomycetota bacterium]